MAACLWQAFMRELLQEARVEAVVHDLPAAPCAPVEPEVAQVRAPKKMQCVRVNIMGGPKGPGEKDGVSHKFSANKTTDLLFRALNKIDLMFNKQLDAWRASDNYLITPPTLSV